MTWAYTSSSAGWIIRGMAIIASIAIMYLLKKEITQRRQQQQHKPLFVSKSLSILSLLTLIFALLNRILLIFLKVKIVCLVMEQANGITFCIVLFSFSFYNLARLYYCFSKTQSHSTNGYPNCLFIIMYTAGFIMCVNFCVSLIDEIKITMDEHGECSISYREDYYSNMASVAMIYIWNAIILFLYYNKLRKFNKLSNDNDANKQIIAARIRFILNKIFWLTLLVNIFTTMAILTAIVGAIYGWPLWAAFVSNIISNISMVGIAGSMYLMIEHNNRNYENALLFMGRIGICCCCKNVLENAKIHALEEHVMRNDKQDDAVSINDTNTKMDTRVDKIEMEDMSLETQTYI